MFCYSWLQVKLPFPVDQITDFPRNDFQMMIKMHKLTSEQLEFIHEPAGAAQTASLPSALPQEEAGLYSELRMWNPQAGESARPVLSATWND